MLHAARIVRRYASSRELQEVQEGLMDLAELSANLDAIEGAFDKHFAGVRTAADLDPQIKSQQEMLSKAKEGRKAAQQMVENVLAILKVFPDDKAALKAKIEADKMVERFDKHAQAAFKIVSTLARKALPASLKKEAAKAVTIIQGRLVNPNALDAIPWQSEATEWIPATSSYGRDQSVKVVQFQVVLRITDPTLDAVIRKGVHDRIMFESTGKPGVRDGGSYRGEPTNAQDFAAAFLKDLVGWTGLKGEAEAQSKRGPIAKAIAHAITEGASRLSYSDHDPVEIAKDGRQVSITYRSDLPKEGNHGIDEDRYRKMVDAEFTRAKKTIEALLSTYKSSIEKTEYHLEEKGWISIEVYIK